MPAATPQQLAASPEHTWTRDRVAERLRCLLGGELPPAPAEHRDDDEVAKALARMLAYQVGGKRGLRLALALEWKAALPPEGLRVLRSLGINAIADGAILRLHFTEYLACAPRLPGFRLIDRVLHQGLVDVPLDDVPLLACEAQARDILRRNAGEKPDPDAALAGPFASVLHASGAVEHLRPPPPLAGPTQPGAFPPCIRELEARLEQGADIGHTGRFALVSFWHAVGLAEEQIVERFAKRPDFDEALTRYHVQHILGHRRERPYRPPGCAKLQSEALCPLARREPICSQVHGPVGFYRLKRGAA